MKSLIVLCLALVIFLNGCAVVWLVGEPEHRKYFWERHPKSSIENKNQQDPNFVGPPESIEGIGHAESLKVR
jgi:hypothetical protein